MKRQIFIIKCIILTAAMILVYSSALLAQIENDSIYTKQRSIIFISDTQSPMWFEKFFVKTHRNKEATQILFDAITHDSTISSVFFLGDITAMSSYDFHWEATDTFLLHLKARHISSYATMGNHDYLLTSASGEANFKQRFPDFQRTGYTIRLGPLAIVLFNSNLGELEDSEKVKQHEWYRHELKTLDQDTTILLTIIGCHHSPYSNSSIVGSSQQVRDEFVPPFTESTKCRLFISGHAHTFQHFIDTVANKHFLVIGGGGGLLHTLKTGKTDELQDQVKWNSEYRMFHFVRGVFTTNGLLLNVMMLTEDLAGPESVYEILLPFSHQ